MSERDREAAETGRVKAEADRVLAEDDRVHAEGGASHEESRREAETGRVDAELGREAAREADATAVREGRGIFLRRWGIMIAIGVGFVAMLPSVFGLIMLDREIHDRCTDAADNREATRDYVAAGLEELGYRYVPATGEVVPLDKGPVAYYEMYPEERAATLERTLTSLNKTFPEIKCDGGVFW